MSDFNHEPVLLRECIEMLRIRENGVYIDGTVGGAGHSSHILEHLGKGGILIGLDQDDDAVSAATKRLQKVKDAGRSQAEYIIVKTNFEKMTETAGCILRERGRLTQADGLLLESGGASYQLELPVGGGGYRFDAPLDMRMNRDGPVTAEDVVNEYPEKELARIIREYGEEKWAAAIARTICIRRKTSPIRTTLELAETIKSAIPARARQGGGHPAKRTFQAIRIEVNRELEVLEKGMDEALGLLSENGRLCVITFHSLEDRIVKNKMKTAACPCTCPPDFPICVCGKRPQGKVITNKPIVASEIEQSENNRSHSAKLRVFEKRSDL